MYLMFVLNFFKLGLEVEVFEAIVRDRSIRIVQTSAVLIGGTIGIVIEQADERVVGELGKVVTRDS